MNKNNLHIGYGGQNKALETETVHQIMLSMAERGEGFFFLSSNKKVGDKERPTGILPSHFCFISLLSFK